MKESTLKELISVISNAQETTKNQMLEISKSFKQIAKTMNAITITKTKVKPVKLIKSCDNCINNVEYPPPHTCDECDSLDNPDYYMW